MFPVGQYGIDARRLEHGCGLVGRCAGINWDTGATDPLDRQERLDGGRCVPVPKADTPPLEAPGKQRLGERRGAAPRAHSR